MEKKIKNTQESDTDKVAKAESSKPEKLKTDHPLAEKDEVKQAEENMRRRIKKDR